MTTAMNDELHNLARVQAAIARLAQDPDAVPASVRECCSLADLERVCLSEAAALPRHQRTGRFAHGDDATWRALDCGAVTAAHLRRRAAMARTATATH